MTTLKYISKTCSLNQNCMFDSSTLITHFLLQNINHHAAALLSKQSEQMKQIFLVLISAHTAPPRQD